MTARRKAANILMGKAFFLTHEKRFAEAHAIYAGPAGAIRATGMPPPRTANALGMMNRHGEALAGFETVIARHGGNADVYRRAAEPALLGGDPQKACMAVRSGAATCAAGWRRAGHPQHCLVHAGRWARRSAERL